MTHASETNIPVKDPNGKVIGRARLSTDGIVELFLNPQFVRELNDVARTGMCAAISIAPVLIPARPALRPGSRFLDDPKIRIVDFGKSDLGFPE